LADAAEFNGTEPFDGVAGGTAGIVERLVSSDKILLSMIPVGQGKLALQRFGQLVARAGLNNDDTLALDSFVDIGFDAMAPQYCKAVTAATAVLKQKVDEGGGGVSAAQVKGTKAPSESEAAKILLAEGVPWYEVVAGGCAVSLGTVPSMAGLIAIGYGGDPVDSDACTRRRKQGQLMAMNFIKNKDAVGLFDMHMSAAKSLAAQGYGMTASDLMVKCNSLYRLTIAVDFPEGYLAYWVRELEDNTGKRVCAKIDQETLSEIMLPRAMKGATAADMSGSVAFLRGEVSEAKLREGAMRASIDMLRQKLLQKGGAAGEAAGEGPEKKCWKCGSTEHMSWSKACPKYKPPKAEGEDKEDKEKEE